MRNSLPCAVLSVLVALGAVGCPGSSGGKGSAAADRYDGARFRVRGVGGGNVVVLDQETGQVWRRMFNSTSMSTSNGAEWEVWRAPVEVSGAVRGARFSLEVVGEGNVVVVDQATGSVWRRMFNPTTMSTSGGSVWEVWEAPVEVVEAAIEPRFSLHAVGDGNVVVLDQATGSVWRRMFNPATMSTSGGSVWEVWEAPVEVAGGSGFSLAVVGENNVVVMDQATGRVQRRMYDSGTMSTSGGEEWEVWEGLDAE